MLWNRREAVILMRKLTLSLVVVLINGRSALALLAQVQTQPEHSQGADICPDSHLPRAPSSLQGVCKHHNGFACCRCKVPQL